MGNSAGAHQLGAGDIGRVGGLELAGSTARQFFVAGFDGRAGSALVHVGRRVNLDAQLERVVERIGSEGSDTAIRQQDSL